ncbi:MAG: glutamine-hydrolyzing carbamoyl-phosphate synthase small subunit [Myxococcaceae bacterium]
MQLNLDDGTMLNGRSFGAVKSVSGEVVFNTAMTGYVEALTDPSYRGQILVLTYPLQGNYGVPKSCFESKQIQVQGLVVSHYTETPSHYTSTQSLGSWLKQEGIPAIAGIDTRSLTRRLRGLGTCPGTLLSPGVEPTSVTSVLKAVAPEKITRYGSGDARILLIDTGSKENIVRCLLQRGVQIIRAPWDSSWEDYLGDIDGVFLTNGPGDPMDARNFVDRVRKLLALDKPIFGICFGHQLLSLAAGAKTMKMKFGHRSANQPVRDVLTNKCYITSQNHGFMVQNESVPRDFQSWFVNLNDGTNEGVRHVSKPIFSVQFHPEASPGPHDTAFLFDDYTKLVMSNKKSSRDSSLIQKLPEGVIL